MPTHHVTRTSYEVGMIDVDLVQIHFASYYRWMDLAYGRLLVDLGHPLASILRAGHGTPIVNSACNYRTPVGLGDVVDVATWIENVGRTSFAVHHEFSREGQPVAVGETKHVWLSMLDGQTSAVPVPAWLADAAAAR